MGRKSNKKRNQKKWVKKVPDEAYRFGPLRVERFGRFIRLSNNASPEEQAELLKRAKVINKEIPEKLEKEINSLQKLIKTYDPLELMHRAAYVLLPLFVKYKSEGEYGREETTYLPTVEYLQYLIARTEANIDGKIPSEKEWEELWNKALEIFKLTQEYLFTRETNSTPPTVMDEIRFDLDSRRLMIRIKRYPIFLSDHLSTSLNPYESQITEVYGITVEQIINGLQIIDEYQKKGVLKRYEDVLEVQKKLEDKLVEKGCKVDSSASSQEIEKTRAMINSVEFVALREEMEQKLKLTFTPAIFEITDLTKLPKPFLSMLSVKPGESVLTSLTGPNKDDLSPLSPSTLHQKPFLEYKEKFYTFYHSGFEDKIAEIIESDLFQKRQNQVTEMAKKRSIRIETDSKFLFSSIVNPDYSFLNVYYPNPDKAGGLTELDLLMIVDDILLLIEVKAGGFSQAALRGAPKSVEQELSDLIIEGQRQSERAEKYINSKEEAIFYDETGKNEVVKIKRSDYRKVFRIVITREDLGWVGARIAILSILDPKLGKQYPWHVSLDDLRVVAELFKNDEIRFIHYLEQRLLASSEEFLSQNDEIEHIGLYNSMNMYYESPIKEVEQLTYDPSYMREIDHYFMGKVAGETKEIPTQKMPSQLKKIIYSLKASKLSGRFEVGSLLLSLDEQRRNEFHSFLDKLEVEASKGKQLSIRLPFHDNQCGISVTYANNLYWDKERKLSAVQMLQSDCNRWLIIQLKNQYPYVISRIDTITLNTFSEEELESEKRGHEKKLKQRITAEKPRRNDQCPCGSGKKYKKCHGL